MSARTDAAAGISEFVAGNDFDPDGDNRGDRGRHPPTAPSVGTPRPRSTPDPGFSGLETITYHLHDSHGMLSTGTWRVWVDSGTLGSQSPIANARIGRSSTSIVDAFRTRLVARQRRRPARRVVECDRRVGTVQRRRPHRHPRRRLRLHPSDDPAFINTDHSIEYLLGDTAGHVVEGRLTIRILADSDPNNADPGADRPPRRPLPGCRSSWPETTSIPTVTTSR